MNSVTAVMAVLLAGIFTSNMVLSRFLGICSFLGVSKKVGTAVSMGVAVTLVMVLATAVTWPIYTFLLVPNGLEYLQTIVFILVIAALVQLMEIVIKRFLKPIYVAFGIYLSLITTNCAVLGITLMNTELANIGLPPYLHALINALAAGLGFLLAMFIFSGIRVRIESSDIPRGLQGLPITLIAAALVSLSFLGFSGI